MREFASCMGDFARTFALFIWGLVIGGLVVDRFYYWFALPIFIALPAITYYQAIGLYCFLSLFKTIKYEPEEENSREKLIGSLFLYPILLFLGWLVHLFIS